MNPDPDFLFSLSCWKLSRDFLRQGRQSFQYLTFMNYMLYLTDLWSWRMIEKEKTHAER
jgi:hypothetical protein